MVRHHPLERGDGSQTGCDSSEADAALEKLCRAYWRPLYAYFRRDGQDAAEAQDLTQEFFARLLVKDYLQNLRHQEGKFRSFLLAYLVSRPEEIEEEIRHFRVLLGRERG